MKHHSLTVVLLLMAALPAFNAVSQTVFEKDGKVGLVDSVTNKVILKPKYKAIGEFEGDYAVAENKDGLKGVINRKGKTVVDFKFQDVRLPLMTRQKEVMVYTGTHGDPTMVTENYLWVRKDDQWQLSSNKGEYDIRLDTIVETPFATFGYDKENGWNQIVPSNDPRVPPFSKKDFWALTRSAKMPLREVYPGLWQINNDLLDAAGELVTHGFISVKESSTPGYVVVNFYEKILKNKTYNNLLLHTQTLTKVDSEKLRLAGDEVVSVFEPVGRDILRNECAVCVDDNGKYGVVDNNGNIILPFAQGKVSLKKEEFKNSSDYFFEVDFEKLPMDPDSIVNRVKPVIFGHPGPDFILIKDSKAMALYKNDIDKYGNGSRKYLPVEKGDFDMVETVDGGWRLKKGNDIVMIARDGKKIEQPAVGDTGGGYASMTQLDGSKYYVVSDGSGKEGLLDTESNTLVLPIKYARIGGFFFWHSGKTFVEDNAGNNGLYDYENRKWMLPLGSFTCQPFLAGSNDDIYVVEKNDKYGAYIDGKVVVSPKHDKWEGAGPTTIQFSDPNKYGTGFTYYIYDRRGKLLTSKFFYNDERRKFNYWYQRQPQ